MESESVLESKALVNIGEERVQTISSRDSTTSYGSISGHSRSPPLSSRPGSKSPDNKLIESRERRRNSSFSISYSRIVLGLTKKQWKILFILGAVEFTYCLILLDQGIFFPPEARRKGVSASLYGFVFGLYDLAMCIMSLTWGKYMGKIGPKYLYIFGIFTSGICSILFGLLYFINNPTFFSTYAFSLRIIEGIAEAGFQTASFTIIVLQFPSHTGTTFACLQGVFGFGFIAGPHIVGNLFQRAGGFPVPFLFTGISMILIAFCCIFILPNSLAFQETTNDEEEQSFILGKNKSGLLSLLKIPPVLLDALSIVPAAISIGFLEATLESHLQIFSLEPIYTSLVYSIFGVFYCISSPIWGFICDRIAQQKYITLIGCILIALGFSLIGPLPFLPFEPILWVTCFGLILQGIGTGATFVSAFLQALADSLDNGFPDNINTYGIVSGMWKSFLSFGNFVGPSAAGLLYDAVGFRYETLFVIGAEIIIIILSLSFILRGYFKKSTYEELTDFENDHYHHYETNDTPEPGPENDQDQERPIITKPELIKQEFKRRVSFDEKNIQLGIQHQQDSYEKNLPSTSAASSASKYL